MRQVTQRSATGRLCTWLGALVLAVSAWSGSNVAEAAPKSNAAQAAAPIEYQVKAGYLFNFAKFVEWPATAANAHNEFRIGIIDDGDVFPIISSALDGKTVQERKVAAVHLKPDSDLKDCHVVFIARSKAGQVEHVLEAIGSAPVLTVGESEKFAAKGGAIGFVVVGENIRFEINLAATERAGLKVSSKMASMAIIVRSKEGKK